jgi:hypothetical protein
MAVKASINWLIVKVSPRSWQTLATALIAVELFECVSSIIKSPGSQGIRAVREMGISDLRN